MVKGAYNESSKIAYKDKASIRNAAIEVMQTYLESGNRTKGTYLALGSHDPYLINWLIAETQKLGIPKDQFEFQMLLGIRRDEQRRLAVLVLLKGKILDCEACCRIPNVREYPVLGVLFGRKLEPVCKIRKEEN